MGGGGKVKFRLSGHLRILLFMAGEPQKLDRQKYMSLESSFRKLFKNRIFSHLRGIGLNFNLTRNHNDAFRIDRSIRCISLNQFHFLTNGTATISPLSLEIEFNTVRFINYTIPRLCSTSVVQSVILFNRHFWAIIVFAV